MPQTEEKGGASQGTMFLHLNSFGPLNSIYSLEDLNCPISVEDGKKPEGHHLRRGWSTMFLYITYVSYINITPCSR